MTQVHELRDNSRTEQGIGAQATRTFRVWTPSTYEALRAAGVPLEGDSHPDDTTVTVNSRVAVREVEHDACIVTVTYERPPFQGGDDSDGLLVFDTVRKLGRVSIDIQSERVVSTYPVLRPRFIAPASAELQNPPPAGRLAWSAVDGSTSRIRTVLTVRTAFRMTYTPTLPGLFAAFQPVTEQTDRLHVIDGRLYQFACRQINQATEPDGVDEQTEIWNAEYSWAFDPGVRVPSSLPAGWTARPDQGAVGDEDIRLPYLAGPAGDTQRYVVPPWSNVLTGPLELPDQSLTDPTFYAQLIPDISANGWQGLPGLTA